MRKHFHSRFPVANMRHISEWFAMDSYIADVPAFDDGVPSHGGCTMTQIYGGLDSELLFGHPMQTKPTLPESLHEFICEYGAMEGLKSDRSLPAQFHLSGLASSYRADSCRR